MQAPTVEPLARNGRLVQEALDACVAALAAVDESRVRRWDAAHLSLKQVHLLHVVAAARGRPPTLTQIARALDVPAGTVTGLVDRLVELGMADRITDRDDRRVRRVALTDAGRELFAGLRGEPVTRLRDELGQAPPDRVAHLAALMESVASAGAATNGGRPRR